MRSAVPTVDAACRAAYEVHERQSRINTGKVAAALVAILMPFGTTLDLAVYSDKTVISFFFILRMCCAAVAIGLWLTLFRQFGQRQAHLIGLLIALVPSFFICWMIYDQGGPDSPYYAGLNLILLAISAVAHWSTWESLVAATGMILMYLIACLLHTSMQNLSGIFVSNLIFLVETAIIVVVGNHFYNKLLFSEFVSGYELDQNRKKLEVANQKLVELDETKSRFFANISHELRTPLTLLLSPLESLMHRHGQSFDEETRQLLDTMHANGMRLLKLINDLLTLVRLESGRMEVRREPLEIGAFIRGIASAARQVAHDKKIRLELQIDLALGTILTDRDKLEKILLNLVFNALKFTASGGHVEIRAHKEGDHFVLAVADTGVGIPAQHLPHIFSRFHQVDDSARRKYQGVGIGLALVKELTELQGGTTSVASEEGKGTTFTVRLPWQPAEAAIAAKQEAVSESAADQSPAASSEEWLSNLYRRAELFPAMAPLRDAIQPLDPTHAGKRFTVLVADDEPDMLRFLKSQLSTEFEVIEASDGAQAVEKAGQFLPDIALLDMMMPEKDGLEACREIRDLAATHNMPIVLLTARADEETKLAALEAGANDFLAKPFSTTELHVRLRNLIESHQFQRRLSRQNQLLESTIDQLKDTETQLVQSAKLASLGRMSAGIIHEINNPLNFATTGLYTLRSKARHLPREQQQEYNDILKDVEEGITRVKNIVTDLRTFSHPEAMQREAVNLANVVAAARRFLSSELKNGVAVAQNLAESQTVLANKNKLLHVLVNLLQNSLDALKTKQFQGERPTIWIEGRRENDRSLLVIRDNGTGIAAEHLDKIFDPFFTTKDVGQGMGLGLSICYRIINECGGRITVRTEPGQFCEFTLDFPAAT